MICQNCGNRISSLATACSICGEKTVPSITARSIETGQVPQKCEKCSFPLMGKTTCTLCGHVNSKAQTNGKVETVRPPIIIDEPKKENQPVRKEPIKRSRPAPVQKAKPDKAQVRQTVKGEKKYASRVMARGRVTIPKQVREMLDVGEGDALIFKVAEGVITVMKVQKDT